MNTACPECGQQHTDKEHPTIGDILGPCADVWFAKIEAEAAELQKGY